MSGPSIAELLPPLQERPWVTVQERLQRAREALAEIRSHGYDISVFPNGRDLYVIRRGRTQPPPRVAELANRHHNALVALVRLPDECESVVGVIVPGRQNYGA